MLATGTPMKNGRPANLFPLLAATDHPLGRHKRAFDTRYCEGHFNAWGGWVADGAANLAELHERIRPVMLRMTKADCLDLPPKVRPRVRPSTLPPTLWLARTHTPPWQKRVFREALLTPEGRRAYEAALGAVGAKQCESGPACAEQQSDGGRGDGS